MLTDREAIALTTMSAGDFLALGDWEDVAESLQKKGYARHLSGKYYRRTLAGAEALAVFEDAEFRAMMGSAPKPADEFDGVTIEGEAEHE